MIASDIHGSAYYCNELLMAYKREKADRLQIMENQRKYFPAVAARPFTGCLC